MTYEEMKAKIKSLPSGGITHKTIHGKKYTYYQWTENGKQKSRTVKPEELEQLQNQITERKALQEELKSIDLNAVSVVAKKIESNIFKTDVRINAALDAFISPVTDYKKREIYANLDSYVHGDFKDKVFILYGLRRTGKTTLIRQIILNMSEVEKSQTAFLQINSTNNLRDVNNDLRLLEEAGYKYVFIDEVTLMDGFIEGAALFSDIFASSGMKIVLSGTDSLGFLFSQDEQLYDRCIMLHTTFISYREFENVLGIKGVDEYIRFGGTMSQSGENYNKNIFSSKKTTDEYVNTAIARNIQHSLKNYQNEGHFRGLYSLYEKNELTNAINRIVEDLNHRFTLDILTRKFKSHDFGSAKDLLLKDKENPSDSLYELNSEKITSDLMNLLEIKNKEELLVGIEDCHRTEIKEYLELLDLICEIDIVNMTNLNQKNTMIVFSQPGLRYSQAESLIKVLMNDELFKTFSLDERKHITEKILEDVKGRMLEEIVLLETKKANPELEVFKLQFAIGEFDMVIFDEDKGECQLFEIKHTNEPFENQYRHLTDQNKLAETQNRFGKITRRCVLYRGNSLVLDNGIEYKNVEEFLKG